MIRAGTETDAAAAAALHRASVRGLCAEHYPTAQIEAWVSIHTTETYERVFADESLVALVEEAPDGLRGVGICSPAEGVVRALYVDPVHTGHGVGLAMLRSLEQQLAAAGRRRVRLNATNNAVGFYLAAGYRNDGDATNVLPSGLELPCVAMSRIL